MNREAAAALERALELSRELAALAERGDVRLAASLDARRRELLESLRPAFERLDEKERGMLCEIAQLNARAIGSLEHRFRAKCRDIDLLTAGRRALRAYSTTGA